MITFLSKPNADVFEASTSLDGREFFLRFRKITRSNRWHVDLLNSDRQIVAANLRIVHDIDMLEGRVGSEVPPGELSAVNTERQDQPVTSENLSITSFLGYLESIDLERLQIFIDSTSQTQAVVS